MPGAKKSNRGSLSLTTRLNRMAALAGRGSTNKGRRRKGKEKAPSQFFQDLLVLGGG